ncbi:hypothetical protein HanRHA438_Chr17g0806761 [Helianthus annuus]|nr:hypothetical protein HanHA89_Chr17g0701181 [Helianthus annuus]KAJ0631967.1 hypothetical protein HanLR1_Chr17g0659831 [Helianthus annuus]KAJ0825763.1 hypothetical protein HanRHA438_Chr17g0806761 [Helianthus annuus]
MFDFIYPPRHAALKAADRVLGEQEPDVLKIHLEQFLLPAVPADPVAYVTMSPPSGGGSVVAMEKKPVKLKITGRKYLATGADASAVSVTTPAGSAAELTSPTHVSKKRKTVTVPSLNAFEAIQAAYALPLGTTVGVRVESVTPAPSTSLEATPSTVGETSLTELILQASVTAAVSCTIPPPLPTAAVTVTISPVSTPLSSSVAPSSLFNSPFSIFSATEKEMPTVSAAYEATSAGGTATSDAGGSSSDIADDGARLGDDLYLPTINWDPNMQDKRYQPRWKIAESSRMIPPPPAVIQHWVERAYPPAESAYIEGLNNENLMNSTMVDAVSQPRRLAEIRRRWMHDNNELHQARAAIQELQDEKYRLESQLQAAGLRESRFLSKKNKVEDDFKRVTANLAEERIMWARDIAEKDRVLAYAKNVQEELERKVISEAQKVRSEISTQVGKFRIDTDFVSHVQERYQALTVEVEASNAKARAKQTELEEREEHLRKLQQHCDSLISEKNALAQSSATCLKRWKVPLNNQTLKWTA